MKVALAASLLYVAGSGPISGTIPPANTVAQPVKVVQEAATAQVPGPAVFVPTYPVIPLQAATAPLDPDPRITPSGDRFDIVDTTDYKTFWTRRFKQVR